MKCKVAISEQILFCDWPLHGLEIWKALTARGKKSALILKILIHNYRIAKMFYVQ